MSKSKQKHPVRPRKATIANLPVGNVVGFWMIDRGNGLTGWKLRCQWTAGDKREWARIDSTVYQPATEALYRGELVTVDMAGFLVDCYLTLVAPINGHFCVLLELEVTGAGAFRPKMKRARQASRC